MDKSILKAVYLAGLLHDTGKYIQKYSKSNFKHHTASQLFILQNPNICGDADVELIASMASHHHKDRGTITVGDVLSPKQTVSADLITRANKNYELTNAKLDRILQLADQFSASSDRASELIDGQKGGRAPYAPLISTIGQACGERLAVRHGIGYEVYEYTGEDEKDSTIEALDPGYKDKITTSFNAFMDSLEDVSDITGLNQVLEYYWQNVNANTWKPSGASLGNTTTSLYDHSKTTAAIAACIYINTENGYTLPSFSDETAQISILHITSNNCAVIKYLEELLNVCGLEDPNVITKTYSEAYVMVPDSILPDIKEKLKLLNKDLYVTQGGTLDYDIAPNWQFKNCRVPFAKRFTEHTSGILQLITSMTPAVNDTYHGYRNRDLSKDTICGYVINQYDMIIDYSSANDSISKVTTTIRIFEQFEKEVVSYLMSQGCKIIKLEFSKCIYAVPKDVNIHQIEYGIYKIFLKYTQDVTGLTFTDRPYDRYSDVPSMVENELEIKKRSLIAENAARTTIKIRRKRMPISSVHMYLSVIKQASALHKNTAYKLIVLYTDLLRYSADHNTVHLMAISRLQRLINQTKDNEENKADIEFMKTCLDNMYNRDKDMISTKATIYYEALKTFVSTKGDSK